MFIQHSVKDFIAIVTVEGYINHTNAVQFEEYIGTLAKEYSGIIINCLKLDYISSTGFGAIMYAQRVVEAAGGIIVLCNCNREISTLMNIIAIPIKQYDSIEKAIEAIKDSNVKLTEKSLTIDETTKQETSVSQKLTKNNQVERPSIMFNHPLIIECPNCKAMVRVSSPGKFKCPDCGLLFAVDDDQTVYFN